jgi:8-oxo-dGTP pyrophosphatase MutT (NUDIX family)
MHLPILTNNEGCPFGLNITSACLSAGNSVDKMTPIMSAENVEEKQKILESNLQIWKNKDEPSRCKYANKIITEKRAVQCGFEEHGVDAGDLTGSPSYARVLNDYAISGTFTTPQGFNVDNNTSRNLFYGILSLNEADRNTIVKVAENVSDKMGACGAFICKDDNTLFLMLRSDDQTWGLPGGHLEEGEFPGEGFIRETIEEAGSFPTGIIADMERIESDWGTTFLFYVILSEEMKEMWQPRLNFEHEKCGWFDIDNLPENLHVSARYATSDNGA